MLPVARARLPAQARACRRNSVSVVLPFVPVTAMTRPRQKMEAKSSSEIDMHPQSRAISSQGWPGWNPGEKTTSPCVRALSGVNSAPLRS